jgi:PHD/YefM family antitoxin component YafN of YafNO toxin-antitoxin module
MSTATLTIVSDDPTLKDLGEREVVLVPLDKYNALMDRLEDLEDLIDMLEALKEPRRPLAEYLAEVKARADV